MRYLLLALFCITSISTVYGQKNDFYSKHWSNVYKHELKELPKSALAVVDSIYVRAKRDKHIEELIKALIYQSKFAVHLQENAEVNIITKFKDEISQSERPLTNLLESVLANIYWEYFKQNRWKYYERSRNSKIVNEQDFRTWDAGAMFSIIHHHFQNSLKNGSTLQTIKLESVDEILIQADNSKKYRPTLYDFLVHNAIDFYSTNESTITKPSNEFKIDDDKYFLEFEKLEIQRSDSLSPLRQALILYQDLLAFHQQRRDTTAYVSLEIERLNLVASENILDPPIALHPRALTALKDRFKLHPASALVSYELASILNKQGGDYQPVKNPRHQFKKAEAINLCNEAISVFPKSDGAKKCEALKEVILQQQLSIVAEKYIPISTPAYIFIRYANVDSLYFSVRRISAELDERLASHVQDDSITWTEIATLVSEKNWSIKLKNLSDYQSHTTEVVLPSLPAGRFVVLATTSGNNKSKNQVFGFTTIQVTNLALLEYTSGNEHYYQVLDRNNGQPIEGADIQLKNPRANGSGPQFDQRLTTEKHGIATYKKVPKIYSYLNATVRYHGDEATFGDYYVYPLSDRNNQENEYITARSFLFTDRSIYRPGQVVFFKGILIQTRAGKSSVVPGQYVSVYLEDVNGEEVGTARLKTNAFGSFSGEFKLPASGLTGEYTLYADEDDEETSRFYDNIDDFVDDGLSISVEEYKRPTFEATFKPVKETFILNDTATITGAAEALSIILPKIWTTC